MRRRYQNYAKNSKNVEKVHMNSTKAKQVTKYNNNQKKNLTSLECQLTSCKENPKLRTLQRSTNRPTNQQQNMLS